VGGGGGGEVGRTRAEHLLLVGVFMCSRGGGGVPRDLDSIRLYSVAVGHAAAAHAAGACRYGGGGDGGPALLLLVGFIVCVDGKGGLPPCNHTP
jgi:hypothetical protein